MTGIQIFLIFVGILAVVCSFVFSDKLESKDNSINQKVINQDIEKITKDIVKKQVDKEVDRIIDDKLEVAEVELDKISNEKILAIGDYYETVIKEISKNHEEVMFLYGMLNDKEKVIKNTVRDVENVKKSVVRLKEMADEESLENNDTSDAQSNNYDVNEKNIENENVNNSDKIKQSEVSDIQKDNKVYKAEDNETTKFKTTANSKNGKKKGVALSIEEAKKNTNNNQMILNLYKEGLSNVEIAKQLKLGVGEVRLIIDLYKNRK